LNLVIEDGEGRRSVRPFTREELSVGRQEGNTLQLPERTVSRRHALLRRVDGHVLVEDLGSRYGVWVNGRRARGPTPVHPGDRLQIGDYALFLELAAGDTPPTPAPGHGAGGTSGAGGGAAEGGRATDGGGPSSGGPSSGGPSSGGLADGGPAARTGAPRPAGTGAPGHRPRLRVLSTELAGQERAWEGRTLRVGRAEDNDWVLEHRSLSRHHAELVLGADGRWVLVDLQSANGVWVNGEPQARAVLRHGDRIELGQLELRFLEREGRGAGLPARLLAAALALAALGAVGGTLLARRTAAAPPAPRSSVEGGAPRGAGAPEAPVLPAAPGSAAARTGAAATAGAASAAAAVVSPAGGGGPGATVRAAAHVPAVPAATAASAAPPRARPLTAGPSGAGARAAVLDLYAQGREALGRGQVALAVDRFQRCLALDAGAAVCHLGLGGAYARTPGRAEAGAAHYRHFLALAPGGDPAAAEVRRLLEHYERARGALAR
jgi:pSer/pThr/pTyr-binding forkhead associated (FHA) protein